MLIYDLKVGYSCNNHCKHCVVDDSKDKLIEQHTPIDLTKDECFSLIDKALSKGITGIVLTGGEITIRPDFLELLNKCAMHNLAITVQTNGRLLAQSKIINAVRNIKNIKFVVALHGGNASTHDEITQRIGSFKETCNGIRAMLNIEKQVIIKVVISKINVIELSTIVELISDLGAKYICFAFPHGQGAARKNFAEIIPTYTYIKPYIENVIKIAKKNNINIEFEAIPFCIIPHAMYLAGELKYFDGDTICSQVKEDIFNWNEIRKTIKFKPKQCTSCDMFDFCEGPWAEYTEAFGSEEFIPIAFPSDSREQIIKHIKKYLNI